MAVGEDNYLLAFDSSACEVGYTLVYSEDFRLEDCSVFTQRETKSNLIFYVHARPSARVSTTGVDEGPIGEAAYVGVGVFYEFACVLPCIP